MKRFALWSLLLGFALQGHAQATKSRLGRFQVDKIKGCGLSVDSPGLSVTINPDVATAGNCTASRPCNVDFGDGTQGQNMLTHTYATPGTYKLTVLYQNTTGPPDDITITVDQPIQPNFEIHACSGNDVVVQLADNNYNQYVIDWENDNIDDQAIPWTVNASAQHNYGSPGVKNIAIRGRDSNPDAADNCPEKLQSFTSLVTLPAPNITTITAVDPTTLKVDFSGINNAIAYKLEIAVNNSTTFQVFQSLYQPSTVTLSNLLLDNNYYCFRLSAFDPCTGGNNYSSVVCSQDFDVTFVSGTNQLRWRTGTTGMTGVTITDKDVSTNITTQTTRPGVSTSFNDTDYDCNVEYCYTITVNYGAGSRSTSLEKCGIGILVTNYPSVSHVNSVVDPGVTLSWTVSPTIKVKTFEVSRSELNTGFELFTNTSNKTLEDATYTTEGFYCYQIDYTDNCNNRSDPGITVCPLRLVGSIDEQNVVRLEWSGYKGWVNGVRTYIVEKRNKAGGTISTIDVGLDTTYVDDAVDLDNQVVRYRIRANALSSPIPSYSNQVTFTKEVNLRFPTAFTPNRDKLNDKFKVTGQFVDKMAISIYDRWGVLVFASEENESWDGGRDGLPMPESSYVWKAEITDLAGRKFTKEGTVILLRTTGR